MGKKLLIVHGYSDGSGSFTDLGDFFVRRGAYAAEDVFYLDYASMDDEATFRDFADKLDSDYEARFKGERIDVACHSTGALVVRAWLAMHHIRNSARRISLKCPVDRLLMFAPANFGSDLARLGQSFLGKFRSTFFNSNSFSEDRLESGKLVLQGLEPASPFQWELSSIDLHGRGYFDPEAPDDERCFPFVLAAGESYGGIQGKLLKPRSLPGTDGTVRIAGTSLNSNRVTLSFRPSGKVVLTWHPVRRFPRIPFCVFAGYNHGSIVHPSEDMRRFTAKNGPGTLALEALEVDTIHKYRRMATRFEACDRANFAKLGKKYKSRYQQFFFRVRDDVDLKVDDYFVDFYVLRPDGTTDRALTAEFDRRFEGEFYSHSADPSYRVMMLDCTELEAFVAKLQARSARLVFDVTAKPPLPNVTYRQGYYVVYDGTKTTHERTLIEPNSTMLVDIVLNRDQASKLSELKDSKLEPAVEPTSTTSAEATGRATLLR